jgi:hypothetical protein
VIVKRPQPLEVARTGMSRAELRDALIELWAQVLEAELRAHLEAAADDQQDDTAPSPAGGDHDAA